MSMNFADSIKQLLIAFIILLLLGFLPYLVNSINHDLLYKQINPSVKLVVLIIICLASILLSFRCLKWLTRESFLKGNREPILLFAIGALCLTILNLRSGDVVLDFHVHDT